MTKNVTLVFVHNLELLARIGVHGHEHGKPQPVRINVWLTCKTSAEGDKLDNVVDYEKNEIQYWQEDPSIRKLFDEKLAARGFQSQMPPDCYSERDFDPEWGRQGAKTGGAKSPYAADFAARVSDYLKAREVI
jgi:hypothetical protein